MPSSLMPRLFREKKNPNEVENFEFEVKKKIKQFEKLNGSEQGLNLASLNTASKYILIYSINTWALKFAVYEEYAFFINLIHICLRIFVR
jgi:hypothetical protein